MAWCMLAGKHPPDSRSRLIESNRGFRLPGLRPPQRAEDARRGPRYAVPPPPKATAQGAPSASAQAGRLRGAQRPPARRGPAGALRHRGHGLRPAGPHPAPQRANDARRALAVADGIRWLVLISVPSDDDGNVGGGGPSWPAGRARRHGGVAKSTLVLDGARDHRGDRSPSF